MSTGSPSDFLRRVFTHMEDDGQAVLVAINDDRGLRTFMCASDFPENATASAFNLNRDADGGRFNLYWGAASMARGLQPGKRGTEQDIVAVSAIVVDLDDPEAAAQYERQEFPLGYVPTLVVRTSGKRYQLVYRLTEPCYSLDDWRSAARRLRAAWGADWCTTDPTHVWRVPSTMNWPNKKKRDAGRVPEMAELVEDNGGQDFDLSDFEELPDVQPEISTDNVVPFINVQPSQDWQSWGAIVKHLPSWMQAAMMSEELPKAANGTPMDRSGFDFQVAAECVKAGLTEGDHAAIYMLEPNEKYAEKYRERELRSPGSGLPYLASTYKRAYAHVVGQGITVPPPPAEPVAQPEPEPQPQPLRWADFVFGWQDVKDEPDEPIEYLVEPVLMKGAIHCVHGPTGSGKSYYIGHMLWQLARGQNVGPYKIERPARVLYVDAEMGRRSIKRRIKDFAKAYGEDEANNFLTFSTLAVPPDLGIRVDIREPDTWRNILQMAIDLQVEVLVIDNVRTAAPGMMENDADAWGSLNEFWKQCRQAGLTVIYVHHDNKSKEDGTYSGSTNAITVAEAVIGIKPAGESRLEECNTVVRDSTAVVWTDPDTGEQVIERPYDCKHAIKIRYGKHREMDPAQHKTHELAYVRRIDDGVSRLSGFASADATDLDVKLAQLNEAEKCWAYLKGYATGQPMGVRKVAGQDGITISSSTVDRRVKEVEGDMEAQSRVRNVFERGRLFEF